MNPVGLLFSWWEQQPHLITGYIRMTGGTVRETREAARFLAPALIAIGVVLVYPLAYVIRLGFFSYSISQGMRFVGFGNYVRILGDETFHISLKNTFLYTTGAVSIEMLLGFVLANILNRQFPGRNLIRGLLMIPMLASPIVSGIMWRFMYNPDFGIINYFVKLLGLRPQVWTGDPRTALISVIIVDIWEFTPFVILLLLAGLQAIPNEQYEAAMVDGASSWQRLRYVTIPWLKPMILVVLLLRTMDSIKVFDQVYALTGGGPGISSLTTGVYAYFTGFRSFRLGNAAAISWLLALITVVVSMLYIRSIKVPERGG
jgi:multiple sugar transport system permease protein